MNIRADMKPLFADRILATGDVYLDEKIVIHNVKVVQAEKEGKVYSFVSFPEKQRGDKWEPVVMIKDKELRDFRGRSCRNYVEKMLGATDKIVSVLEK